MDQAQHEKLLAEATKPLQDKISQLEAQATQKDTEIANLKQTIEKLEAEAKASKGAKTVSPASAEKKGRIPTSPNPSGLTQKNRPFSPQSILLFLIRSCKYK